MPADCVHRPPANDHAESIFLESKESAKMG
jgi:hypothetical protein